MIDIKKKLIPTFIIFVFLLNVFCLQSFAEDDNNLIPENLDTWYVDLDSTADATISYNTSSELNTISFPSSSRGLFVSYYTIPTINYNHTFILSFDYRGYLGLFNLSIYLQDGDDSENAYLIDSLNSSTSSVHGVSYQFVPNEVLSRPSNVRIVFKFDISSNSSQNVYISNLELNDLTPSSPSLVGFNNAITQYLNPVKSFIFEQLSRFFTLIESNWIYTFIWYVINTCFIIWVVSLSVFRWISIFGTSMVDYGLYKSKVDKRLEQYQDIKNSQRDEAEKRFQEHRQIIRDDFLERQEIFMQNYNSLKSNNSSVVVDDSKSSNNSVDNSKPKTDKKKKVNINIVNDDED